MAHTRERNWFSLGRFQRPKQARSKTLYRRRLDFEPLEERRLLAITWTNRGVAGNDTDGFQGVFGANAELARNAAQGAIDLWSRVITNLNQSGGSNQLDVSINMQTTGVGFGGSGAVTSLIGNKPRTGAILLNRGNDSNNDGIGDGVDWYLDPTPLDNSEYNSGSIINPFAALPNPGSGIAADFMSLVTVELAHIVGLANNNGLAWKNNAFVTNTNQPDVRDAPGTLWRFDGPTISGLLTSNNGGGGGTETGLPVHTAYTPNQYFGPTKSYNGVADVGTAGGDAAIRYLPSKLMAHMLSDVYGYTINEPETFGTFFAMLQSDGQLRIRGGLPAGLGFPSNDSILVFADGANIHVDLDFGNDVIGTGISGIMHSAFLRSQVSSIRIDAGDGNDTIFIGPLQSNMPVTVIGGSGTDTLQIDGSTGNDTLTATAFSASSTFVNITSYSGIDSLLWTPGVGTADVYVPSGIVLPFTINMAAGAGALNIHTLAQFSNLTINGSSGNDTINIAPNAGANAIQSNIAVYGAAGADTLTLGGGNLDSVMGPITFDGGGAPQDTEDRVILNDQSNSFALNYNLTATSLTRDKPLSFGGLNYANISRIILNATLGPNNFTLANDISPTVEAHGNNGDDNFIVGAGNVGFLPAWILDGGSGNDAITFDNHLATINHTVEIQPNQVIFYNGVFAISTSGFETVGWLGGSGNDQVRISGTLSQSVNIDAGLGNDTIVVGYSSQAQFLGNNTINGGAGNDNVYWNRASNNWYTAIFGTIKYNVTIDGGTGFNTLNIDETTRSAAGYYLYADRFYATDGAVFPVGFDIDYDNMQAMSLSAGGGTTNVGVYGTSSDIAAGNQISILPNGGNDAVTLYPHDEQGNLTINGTLGIGGGAGTDTLTVNDTASALPINYLFQNLFGAGTTNIAGMGAAGFGAGSDIETISVLGGSGDDVFRIDSFKSGSGLYISAGGGADTLDITPASMTIQSNVTNAAAFSFDGGEGSDAFNLHNANSTLAFTYNANATSLQATASGYGSFTFSHSNVESVLVEGGTNADVFNAKTVASGQTLSLDGGASSDSYFLGNAMRTNGIAGGVYVYDSLGTDSLSIDDRADATGRTLHVGQDFVGAVAGDNLFAAGGFLYYGNIAGALTIKLGSGSDTVYAVPDSTTPIFIEANNPTVAAPGDWLGLAFANAQNPVFTAGAPGEGAYSFDNAAFFYYSGFESTAIDDAAPYIVAQGYDDTGLPTIFVQFSEDVSNALSVYYLELINTTTTEQVPFAYLDLAYDTGTNTASFTFPGYPDGNLPPGDYTAKIYGSLPDQFGNMMGVETPFLFTVEATPPALPGDYNLNGEVDAADFIVWRKTLGDDVAKYSGADGNGNGNVGPEDYDVWRANLGNALPAPAPANDTNLAQVHAGTESMRGSISSVDSTTAPALEIPALDSAPIESDRSILFGPGSENFDAAFAFASVYGGTSKSTSQKAGGFARARGTADYYGTPTGRPPITVAADRVAFDEYRRHFDNNGARNKSAGLQWEAVDQVFEADWDSVHMAAI